MKRVYLMGALATPYGESDMGAILEFDELHGTPWRPNDQAQLVDIYKKWDYPLAGVFEIGPENRWGFIRLAGVLEPLTFWALFRVYEGWSQEFVQVGDDPVSWLDVLSGGDVQLVAFDEDKGITGYREIVGGLVRSTLLALIEDMVQPDERNSYLEDARLSVAG
jgi:hypothetical protein